MDSKKLSVWLLSISLAHKIWFSDIDPSERRSKCCPTDARGSPCVNQQIHERERLAEILIAHARKSLLLDRYGVSRFSSASADMSLGTAGSVNFNRLLK